MVGGFNPTPLKNDGVKVSWDDYSHIWNGKIKDVPNHQPAINNGINWINPSFSTGASDFALPSTVSVSLTQSHYGWPWDPQRPTGEFECAKPAINLPFKWMISPSKWWWLGDGLHWVNPTFILNLLKVRYSIPIICPIAAVATSIPKHCVQSYTPPRWMWTCSSQAFSKTWRSSYLTMILLGVSKDQPWEIQIIFSTARCYWENHPWSTFQCFVGLITGLLLDKKKRSCNVLDPEKARWI